MDFDEHRPRLRAVAYRMLGSLAEADDAVQETWLRFDRTDTRDVENLGAWLTTVIGRVCLNMLRDRRETPEIHIPDPIVTTTPEDEAELVDSVGLALLVVLDTLAPAERLAFVLHDMFAVPFDEIAPVIDKSPAATRQLASRARRRVQGHAPVPDPDPAVQRKAVDAFFTATREGDFEALLTLLDPDVVLRSDGGTARPGLTQLLQGAHTVASQAVTFGSLAPHVRPVLVNGLPGVVVQPDDRPISVMAFTVSGDRIVAIDVLADPDRLPTVTANAQP
ncbi:MULTISPECIES: sigma-70 family RNA polymerase sigma factor [Actinomadura]|uniref:RNA polymerase sigma factor SigJ n=1 Tax=Actinomadura miaoliensis TaxID=430685 RepID=A0ABP7WJG9_9ACTN